MAVLEYKRYGSQLPSRFGLPQLYVVFVAPSESSSAERAGDRGHFNLVEGFGQARLGRTLRSSTVGPTGALFAARSDISTIDRGCSGSLRRCRGNANVRAEAVVTGKAHSVRASAGVFDSAHDASWKDLSVVSLGLDSRGVGSAHELIAGGNPAVGIGCCAINMGRPCALNFPSRSNGCRMPGLAAGQTSLVGRKARSPPS
jgi:hypothetical protein